MAHLLATVNPAAAAGITPESTLLPKVGHIVKFFPRPGEVRGRPDFSLFVTHVHDGFVDGIVFLEADDFRYFQNLKMRAHDNPIHCWEFLDAPGQDNSELREAVQSMLAKFVLLQKQFGNIQERLEAIEDWLTKRNAKVKRG